MKKNDESLGTSLAYASRTVKSPKRARPRSQLLCYFSAVIAAVGIRGERSGDSDRGYRWVSTKPGQRQTSRLHRSAYNLDSGTFVPNTMTGLVSACMCLAGENR